MNTTVHFWDDSTACVLDEPRANGGVKHNLFESVSACWDYAREIGATITSVITHKINGEEVVTQ